MSYRMDRSAAPLATSRSRPRARDRKEPRGSPPRRPSPGPRNERKEYIPSKKNVTQVRDRSCSEDRARGRKPRAAPLPPQKGGAPHVKAPQKKQYRDSSSPDTTPKSRKSYSPPPKYRQPSPKYRQPSPKYRQPSPKYRQPSPKYRQPSPKKLSPVNRKPSKYSEDTVPISEHPRYKRSSSPNRETVKYKRMASNLDSGEYRRTIPVREEHGKYEFSSSEDKSSLKNIKRHCRSRSCSFANDRKLQERPNFRGADGVSYTRSDLKKLSIGIKRNIPGGGSASMQQKPVNTENIVIVHRIDEGSRPIFDRDEIKAAQKERARPSSVSPPPYKYRRFSQEMHERIVSMLDCNRGARYDSPPSRYEPDRQREFYREPEDSKKYFAADRRYKDDSRYEYDNRSPEYSRYEESRNNEKYLDYRGKPNREKNTFPRKFDNNTVSDYPDERGRRGSRSGMPPVSYRYSPDKNSGKMLDRRNQPPFESRKGSFRGDEPERDDFYENDFSSKMSSRNSSQKPWSYDPEYVPKGRAYFEHDNRESFIRGSRGRGSFRGVTSRGSSQYRGIRNPIGSRGSYVSRGSRPFRRGTGRGFRRPSSSGPRSSSWTHDLYSEILEEDKRN